uniref:Gal4 dimerisation domain-containing protein n=1 Tax=Fusarium oxysporum (strain Fo5176) TaxID=660025 RepID=A0A0C4DJ93_FUSOF
MHEFYLTRVERRLANVERLFGQLLPDVDINEALASQGVETPADASQPNASLSPPTNPTSPHSPVQVGGAISDAVPAESDGFDWQEDVDELTDGMASLSVEPRGAGYLDHYFSGRVIRGPSSAIALRFHDPMLGWSLLPSYLTRSRRDMSSNSW